MIDATMARIDAPGAWAPNSTTGRSHQFIAAHLDEAKALGRTVGDLAHEPAALAHSLRVGLESLADPEYRTGQQVVAPGIGEVLGVRSALLTAVSHALRSATRHDRPTTLLDIAAALMRDPLAEMHWLAIDLLERTVILEPEQSWQLVRAEARRATEWITIDRLAHVAGRGILHEPYRWAELEQLVYSPSRWERRLAASTVATIPFVDRMTGRTPLVAARGLVVVGDLIGDPEPDVQRALSWALRNLTLVDLPAVAALLRHETRTARASADGARAWVIRDAASKLPPELAGELREGLAGIRRRPGAPSTSRAASTAADFLAFGLGVPPAERPTIDRT